jgi:cell division protein FtsI (penicillin-binding protein 3)
LEVKKDILWRVYLIYIGIVVLGVCILSKAAYIQFVEGKYWKGLSDSQHLKYRDLKAERGSLLCEDGSLLSSSIPFFDVHIDFRTDGLRDKNGKIFYDNIDSLSIALSELFNEASMGTNRKATYILSDKFRDNDPALYKSVLIRAYQAKEKFFLLAKNINFQQYQQMRKFPLFRMGRNRSGVQFDAIEKRLTPFGLLANRAIGLSREYIDSNGDTVSKNVGLEKTYDAFLRGQNGKQLVRRVSGGSFIPVEDAETEPENGADVITTLDVNIQDIAENALMKTLKEHDCTFGTAIVMEVKTGKIRAMANLGKQKNDSIYFEDFNYAMSKYEPGSTFKLVTLLSLLEDGLINVNDKINIEGGNWEYGGRVVYDAEAHSENEVTIKQAFELSSNVAMAKLMVRNYTNAPYRFLNRLHQLKFDTASGIDLIGEARSNYAKPKSKQWSATALPWMGFGYNIEFTPIYTLMLYNAIANKGKMMKPYLVSEIKKNGAAIQTFEPTVRIEKICSDATLSVLQDCLEGVVTVGTAKALQTPYFSIAGKTGTAVVANNAHGYNNNLHQSSFVGYFPADNPMYTCIVFVRNKEFATKYFGAQIAGPVFKEIAEKLMARNITSQPFYVAEKVKDSTTLFSKGWKPDFLNIFNTLNIKVKDSAGANNWSNYQSNGNEIVSTNLNVSKNFIPDVKGMGLKDAVYLLENLSLKVIIKGIGKVKEQSLLAGTTIKKGQTIYLTLN